jgi:hypothetical protein
MRASTVSARYRHTGFIGLVARSRQVPTLDSQILTAFLARIGESDQVDNSLIQGLSDMLSNDRLPTPTALVQLYAASSVGADT